MPKPAINSIQLAGSGTLVTLSDAMKEVMTGLKTVEMPAPPAVTRDTPGPPTIVPPVNSE
jgi:hypothetical protein